MENKYIVQKEYVYYKNIEIEQLNKELELIKEKKKTLAKIISPNKQSTRLG